MCPPDESDRTTQEPDVVWFAKLLATKGVEVDPERSPPLFAARCLAERLALLNAAGRAAAKVGLPKGVRLEMDLPTDVDLRVAAGGLHLIRAIRRALPSCPELFDGLWPLISVGRPLALPQPRAEDRDHAWEYFNAAIVSAFMTDLKINTDGEGPDIRGLFRGERWAVECKVAYSSKVARRIEQVMDGVKQIEDDHAVEKGVITLNVTNCVDHAHFERSLTGAGVFTSTNAAIAELGGAVRAIAFEMQTPAFNKRFIQDKHGQRRAKCRAVIFVAQAVALAGGRVANVTTQISTTRCPAEAIDKKFANRYHRGIAALL